MAALAAGRCGRLDAAAGAYWIVKAALVGRPSQM